MSNGEDKYTIQALRKIKEMNYESSKLHHCVRIYTDLVVRGNTKIFFLREKGNLDEPFATIEVAGKQIIQLKAICNRKAPQQAQRFVRKWAKIKKLEIVSGDFS